jgi:hypothetical protein
MFVSRFPVLLSLAVSSTLSHASPSTTVNKTAFVVPALGNVQNISTNMSGNNNYDPDYPGTAVERMMNVRARVKELSPEDLNGDWQTVVRRKILWAGGLRDLPDSIPGQGYTGHSFNDYNHVDLTCMAEQVSDNENDGSVKGIAIGNRLGPGIRLASLPELGPGGSWSTCAMGCNRDPPQDVAHIQFRARIAFKLVWVPNVEYDQFVLVDDDGEELARGSPTGRLPMLRERQLNYRITQGSKYATAADAIANKSSATECKKIE